MVDKESMEIIGAAVRAVRQVSKVADAQSDTYIEAMRHALWRAGIAKDAFEARRWALVAEILDERAWLHRESSKRSADFAGRVESSVYESEELDRDVPIEEFTEGEGDQSC